MTSPAFGWGAQVHRVITRLAEPRLTPKAAAAIRGLLNPGDELVDVCNWADHEGRDVEPRSSPWHYINIPIDADRYDPKLEGRDGSVVTKIKDFRKVLADPKTSRKDRQVALLFLIHLIEDVHNPLHVGDNKDRGGNLTQVRFFNEGTNLHRLWDSDMVRHIGGNDRVWVDRVKPLMTPENVKKWSAGTVDDWTNESLALAKLAYFFPPGAKKPLKSIDPVGKEYLQFAEPILLEQMAKSSVRLANELNAIFK